MLVEFPKHPFWDFSLKVYTSDGVAEACLELQNTHQLDVNILLFCLWYGVSGRGKLSDKEIKKIICHVDIWHRDLVKELRKLRVMLKGGMKNAPSELTESLRRSLQKTEIDAEHIEQLMLATLIPGVGDDSRDSRKKIEETISNISSYFATFGTVSTRDWKYLMVILQTVFPGQKLRPLPMEIETFEES